MQQLVQVTKIYPRCFSLVLLWRKRTVLELYGLGKLATKKRIDSYYLGILWTGIAIKETVKLFAVTV